MKWGPAATQRRPTSKCKHWPFSTSSYLDVDWLTPRSFPGSRASFNATVNNSAQSKHELLPFNLHTTATTRRATADH
ncbi:hypothetical protein LB503_007743 [Fusarium chuoi]|nr:hypothetical protein LB503_007743 [Fusarium chuoi]